MFEELLPEPYRIRESTLEPWEEIRSDLALVRKVRAILAESFVWTHSDVFRLRPDDKLWDIYRCYYPQDTWWRRLRGDDMEMERLLTALQKEAPPERTVDLDPDVTGNRPVTDRPVQRIHG